MKATTVSDVEFWAAGLRSPMGLTGRTGLISPPSRRRPGALQLTLVLSAPDPGALQLTLVLTAPDPGVQLPSTSLETQNPKLETRN
jgi:hypothetical protein